MDLTPTLTEGKGFIESLNTGLKVSFDQHVQEISMGLGDGYRTDRRSKILQSPSCGFNLRRPDAYKLLTLLIYFVPFPYELNKFLFNL